MAYIKLYYRTKRYAKMLLYEIYHDKNAMQYKAAQNTKLTLKIPSKFPHFIIFTQVSAAQQHFTFAFPNI